MADVGWSNLNIGSSILALQQYLSKPGPGSDTRAIRWACQNMLTTIVNWSGTSRAIAMSHSRSRAFTSQRCTTPSRITMGISTGTLRLMNATPIWSRATSRGCRRYCQTSPGTRSMASRRCRLLPPVTAAISRYPTIRPSRVYLTVPPQHRLRQLPLSSPMQPIRRTANSLETFRRHLRALPLQVYRRQGARPDRSRCNVWRLLPIPWRQRLNRTGCIRQPGISLQRFPAGRRLRQDQRPHRLTHSNPASTPQRSPTARRCDICAEGKTSIAPITC